MNPLPIQTLTTKRIDPANGIEYTFASTFAAREMDPTHDDALSPELSLREYILRLFWLGVNIGDQSGYFKTFEDLYPNLGNQMRDILPLFDQFVGQVTIDIEQFRQPTNGQNVQFFFSDPEYIVPDKKLSELFKLEIYNEISKSKAVEFAVFGYYELQIGGFGGPDDTESSAPADPINDPSAGDGAVDKPKKRAKKAKKEAQPDSDAKYQDQPESSQLGTLFSNSKDMNSNEIGIPKMIADGWARGVNVINPPMLVHQIEQSARHDSARRAAVTLKGKKTEVINGKKETSSTEFALDKEAFGIKTAEQCANLLIKIKDPEVMQCFFALWKQAAIQDNATFIDVPLSSVMAHVLKSSDDNKFNKEARQRFTEKLIYLSRLTMSVTQIKTRQTNRGPKHELEETTGISIFRMKAVYSVKKNFQKLRREELRDEHFDQTVINRFTGQLLPDNPGLLAGRANVYGDGLLKMDSNKDGKAIVVGFAIQTRLSQLLDKEKAIEWDRAKLIELCEYEKTDQANSGKATQQIRKVLDKLVAHGFIGGYSGLTNSNSCKVSITPPANRQPD